MQKITITILLFCSFLCSEAQKVTVQLGQLDVSKPVTKEIAAKSIYYLNKVLNLPDFKQDLLSCSFFCSNRPELCNMVSHTIPGDSVYNDLMKKGILVIQLKVKASLPWQYLFTKTYGKTSPYYNSILTYKWWLRSYEEKELVIQYASHVGHEMFHTSYFGYLHDPALGTRGFTNDHDVCYKLGDIIMALIRKYWEP
jgi:hypothetical protein